MTSQGKKIGTASTLLISVMMLSVPQTGFAAGRMPAPSAVVQQQKTITIVDEKGEPIVGASVFEEGTRNGTITDADGNFSLRVKPNATLTVSYIGYGDKMIAVEGKTHLKISMSAEDTELNEVVVTARGLNVRKKPSVMRCKK